MNNKEVRYEIEVKESNGRLVDILCVGTRAGNIPAWAIKSVQQHVACGRNVEIKQDNPLSPSQHRWHATYVGPGNDLKIKIGVILQEEMVAILKAANFDDYSVNNILKEGKYDGFTNVEFECDGPRVFLVRNIDLLSNDPSAYWNTTAASWVSHENASKFTERSAATAVVAEHELSAELEVEVAS